jgi:hypothetical protein
MSETDKLKPGHRKKSASTCTGKLGKTQQMDEKSHEIFNKGKFTKKLDEIFSSQF